ncbi:MAG: phenylacetate-CoA oxygenase subunit PaaJ [Actinobacteria bacterium]|nr:phenylacetate-CoA oxygenase subunit PaaJ [Actinomycetota bacterium]
MVTAAEVRARLDEVKDPEIPACSITDLGMVERVEVRDDAIEVDLVPTFAGCPALDVIARDVARAVQDVAAARDVRVRFVMNPPWTTDRIAPRARDAMGTLGKPEAVRCPYCGSAETERQTAFGPTPCRSIRYCTSCRNPFEAFKEKR